jgi:aldose 1-epimerase
MNTLAAAVGEMEKATQEVFTLGAPHRLRVLISLQGAAWLSARLPMPGGGDRELLMAVPAPPQALARRCHVGVVVGRYANRLRHSHFGMPGLQAIPNEGPNCLHGGPDGWGQRRWHAVQHTQDELTLALRSPAGDQGFPGEVIATVQYRLEADGCSLSMSFAAVGTHRTPVSMTSHAYLNLDGEPSDVRGHHLQLAADRFVPVGSDLIPMGEWLPVAGSDFDFREERPIHRHWLASPQQRCVGGYDHAFILQEAAARGEAPAAALRSHDGLVHAQLWTDQPAVQFYSGQGLPTMESADGCVHGACGGIALEPGVPADSPNHPEWPSHARCWLTPERPWRGWMRWRFEAVNHRGDTGGEAHP